MKIAQGGFVLCGVLWLGLIGTVMILSLDSDTADNIPTVVASPPQNVKKDENIKQTNQIEQFSDSACVQHSLKKLDWPQRVGRSGVILIGYPTSGLDVIRRIITRSTHQPTFSVYKEPRTNFVKELGIELNGVSLSSDWFGEDCHLSPNFPAVVKSYYPSIPIQSNFPMYQKIIRVIRNPVDNFESFWRMVYSENWLGTRQRKWPYFLKYETNEYKKFHDWWNRYQEDMNFPMLNVRYEDLVQDLEYAMRQVFEFLEISSLVDERAFQSALQQEQSSSDFVIGKGLSSYSEEELSIVLQETASLLERFGYEHLFD